jgi:hypothetical protein
VLGHRLFNTILVLIMVLFYVTTSENTRENIDSR